MALTKPTIPDAYDPKKEEPKWQKFWEENHIYYFNPDSRAEVYSIDTPPPTVSGNMHIGHAFSYAQGDFVARYQRMLGKNVFYPFGTDDNGLPTERLVETLKKVRSTTMPREEFVKLCEKTLAEIKPAFVKPWMDLGISVDFAHGYSTIDKHCQRTSQKSFINLWKKRCVYQEETPVSWCTKCQTAIAQAEFDNIEMKSHFNDVVFKVGGRDVVIATTRPELLCACVAIIAHPEDKRYKHLIGKHAVVPLFNYEVPIITDEKADPEKGTGIVMCCTFGDKTDIEWWRKHKLPLRAVIERHGLLNDLGGKYKGLSLRDARAQIIADLKEQKLLVAQKDILHAVNVHERCQTEIEFLKTRQWYIKVLDRKEALIEAADQITWYPDHMKVRYVHWVQNLQWDWCISRQRFFGVPFPVWYCALCGKVKVADEKDLPVDPLHDKPRGACTCGSKEFVSETDVMDTWATSSVTPQIALHWADDARFFKRMYPMSVRFQAHDIIRTWAFYTIVKGVYHHDISPWQNIMIAGHALDPHGKKMSKSKGNVVDPLQVMNNHCADSLRFWAAGSKLGDDLPYQEKDLVTGDKNITKLWNAAKFCFSHLSDYDPAKHKEFTATTIDAWVLSLMHKLIQECSASFNKCEYAKAKAETEKFFFGTLCDNYLEIVKDRLYNPDQYTKEERLSAQYTLYQLLLTVVKLYAPIMPHITEAVYQAYFAEHDGAKSVHCSKWPEFDSRMIEEDAEEAGTLALEIIGAVRKYKSSKSLSLKADLASVTIECTNEQKAMLQKTLRDVQATTRAKKITFEKVKTVTAETEKGLKIEI
ncbi:valine--tRNA ligase [Candidatus Woesearchaeota archaeon]|nr:valine--tRNA ligase [Candidatus Woesearchaeota archaeon]